MHSCAHFIKLCSLILHTLFYCALLHLNFSLILHTLFYCALLHLNFPSKTTLIQPTCGFKCSTSGPPVDSHQDSPISGPPVDPDQPRPPAHLWIHTRRPTRGITPGSRSAPAARPRNQIRRPTRGIKSGFHFFLKRFDLFLFAQTSRNVKNN